MNGIPKSEKDISIFHLPKNWPPMPMHSGIRWKLPSSAILISIWEAYDFRGITLLMEAPRMIFAQTYRGRRPASLCAKAEDAAAGTLPD